MRVALAQLNPTLGDFHGTCEKIVRAAIRARSEGAELTIFPELCLTGYPPLGLLEKPAFLDAQDRALDRLKKALKGLPSLLGYVARRFDGAGHLLFNACALIQDGDLRAVGRKCLLPRFDVFDEARCFEPGERPACVEFEGLRLGLTLGEDAWNDKEFKAPRPRDRDPVEEVFAAGAEVLINLSASPFALGKSAVKETLLSSLARKHRRPLLYVNLVGGNDELIFDGRSMAFSEQGKLIARAQAFEEDVTVVDLDRVHGAVTPRLAEEEEIRKALVLGIRDYAGKCGFDGGVLGLSGGLDSSVTAVLAAEALGAENVIGAALPGRYNSPESLADARGLAERLGMDFHILNIDATFAACREILAPVFAGRPEDAAEENLQARIRGLLLLALSNKFGRLLLSAGNKSELSTGHCTLLGDMSGGLAVLSDVYKTTVYRLARHLNRSAPKPLIPERALSRPPSAELRPQQTDRDALPPYETLDGILKAYLEERKNLEQIVALGFEFETVRRILRLVDFSEYKRRQGAPGLRISADPHGGARRLPIAQRFRESE